MKSQPKKLCDEVSMLAHKVIKIIQAFYSLKEQLEREKKEHQDAISDTERSALQEKQRLRKEMLARIEETKMQMLQHMDEQLHAVLLHFLIKLLYPNKNFVLFLMIGQYICIHEKLFMFL